MGRKVVESPINVRIECKVSNPGSHLSWPSFCIALPTQDKVKSLAITVKAFPRMRDGWYRRVLRKMSSHTRLSSSSCHRKCATACWPARALNTPSPPSRISASSSSWRLWRTVAQITWFPKNNSGLWQTAVALQRARKTRRRWEVSAFLRAAFPSTSLRSSLTCWQSWKAGTARATKARSPFSRTSWGWPSVWRLARLSRTCERMSKNFTCPQIQYSANIS